MSLLYRLITNSYSSREKAEQTTITTFTHSLLHSDLATHGFKGQWIRPCHEQHVYTKNNQQMFIISHRN